MEYGPVRDRTAETVAGDLSGSAEFLSGSGGGQGCAGAGGGRRQGDAWERDGLRRGGCSQGQAARRAGWAATIPGAVPGPGGWRVSRAGPGGAFAREGRADPAAAAASAQVG